MIGLVASFFTIIFAYGRNTYSLSRAGYFPKFLSKTHGTRKTPHVALDRRRGRRATRSLVLVYILQQKALGAQIVAALLNMAVFAAVISYILQMTSFVLLRQKLPNIERPYRSKWGVPGAVDRRRPRRDLARRDLPERGLPPGRVRRRHLLRPRGPVLRDRRAEPAGAVARGGVRAHAGRARRARRQEGYATSQEEQEAILGGGVERRVAQPPAPSGRLRLADERTERRARVGPAVRVDSRGRSDPRSRPAT